MIGKFYIESLVSFILHRRTEKNSKNMCRIFSASKVIVSISNLAFNKVLSVAKYVGRILKKKWIFFLLFLFVEIR